MPALARPSIEARAGRAAPPSQASLVPRLAAPAVSPALSHPRVVLDSAGLAPEAIELANRLAGTLPRLPAEASAELRGVLERRLAE